MILILYQGNSLRCDVSMFPLCDRVLGISHFSISNWDAMYQWNYWVIASQEFSKCWFNSISFWDAIAHRFHWAIASHTLDYLETIPVLSKTRCISIFLVWSRLRVIPLLRINSFIQDTIFQCLPCVIASQNDFLLRINSKCCPSSILE